MCWPFGTPPPAASGNGRPFTPSLKRPALSFVDSLRAQGNTDVYASLQAALSVPDREPGRPALTSGTDHRWTPDHRRNRQGSEIIEGFTQANQGRSVGLWTWRGESRVNRFLSGSAELPQSRRCAGGGAETSQIPYAMERWGAETRRPVLSELTYQFSGVEAASVYPATLTHLYLDRPLTLYARVPADHDPAGCFQIVGPQRWRSYRVTWFSRWSWIRSEAGTADIRSQAGCGTAYTNGLDRYLRTPRDGSGSGPASRTWPIAMGRPFPTVLARPFLVGKCSH
jgi:hypothetical protein